MGDLSKKVSYYDTVPVCVAAGRVMRRLGFQKGRTHLRDKDELFFTGALRTGLSLCGNRAAAGRFAVTVRTEEKVVLEDGTVFESGMLSKLLSRSEAVLLMAGTAGPAITARLGSEMAAGNAALAVVLDAVGSVSADGVMDWLMAFYGKLLGREGRRLTRHRYSPGYGDLHLSNQESIFRLLGLERLGLTLTGTMILEPEKSVLAIAGIERV